jgi:hypothetical protein
MKLFVRAACVAALAFAASGCATITRGTSTDWVIDTFPQGARVVTSNGFSCEATPCQLRMPRESTFTATVTMAGYETETVEVTHVLADGGAAGMVGNAIFGGVIGAAVDANNGATRDLSPNPVMLNLRPVSTASTATGGGSSGISQFVEDMFGGLGF